MGSDLQELIEDWKRRIEANQNAQRADAQRLSKYHYVIGVPTTILTALAGATLLTETTNSTLKIVVGIIGLLAAVLSAVQTFYSHAQRAEQHRSTAARLGQVRREIEILERFPPQKKADQEQMVREISELMSDIDAVSPLTRITTILMSPFRHIV